MNCGGDHQTPCSDVLAELWLFLDNECDPGRKALLQQHLNECNPCLSEYGIEDHLKALLARKCGGEHAPGDLKNRLKDSIREAVQAKCAESKKQTSA
ncbi:mycothiol system anti-sigma-R factor [Pseudonocardiaceae bacterium YIM PH 21723]|nr:mycothiol system anti-sigma-R factor [Pseudonocardiaceae bacterium YIM PH 21723]